MFAYQIDREIALELLEPRHAGELYALTDANRMHLRRWLPWLDRTQSVDETMSFIRISQQQQAENNGFQTVIRYQGAAVGVIGHHRIDWSNRFASIGYWIAESVQGQGIVTKACRAHVGHLIGELSLHRIEIRCAVGNIRSRAIPQRLGFREEGVIRDAEWLYDHFVDHVVYGLLESEWDRDSAVPI